MWNPLQNRRSARPRRNGLDRMIRALRQAGRYSLSGALVALAGCVPSPDLIGVSPDGRYVVVPVNQLGVAVAVNDASSIVRVDLQTGDVQVLGPTRKGAHWMNINGGVVVYGLTSSEPSIVIHDGFETPAIVKQALFPSLSPDGKSIVYASMETWSDQQSTLAAKLMRREVKGGKTTDLKITGTVPQFSPDGKRILFVTGTDNEATLEIADADGGNRRKISTIKSDLNNLFRPRWLDDKTLLYRAQTPQTGEDGELFLTTLDGKTEQVTMNDVQDITPVYAGKDRIIWRELAMGWVIEWGDDALPLWISEKKDGKWTSRELGIKALAVSVVGDDLIYVDIVEGEKLTLHKCPIADTSKRTDLGALIKEKVPDLPASTGGQLGG